MPFLPHQQAFQGEKPGPHQPTLALLSSEGPPSLLEEVAFLGVELSVEKIKGMPPIG